MCWFPSPRVFYNAWTYNPPGDQVYHSAQKLGRVFETELEKSFGDHDQWGLLTGTTIAKCGPGHLQPKTGEADGDGDSDGRAIPAAAAEAKRLKGEEAARVKAEKAKVAADAAAAAAFAAARVATEEAAREKVAVAEAEKKRRAEKAAAKKAKKAALTARTAVVAPSPLAAAPTPTPSPAAPAPAPPASAVAAATSTLIAAHENGDGDGGEGGGGGTEGALVQMQRRAGMTYEIEQSTMTAMAETRLAQALTAANETCNDVGLPHVSFNATQYTHSLVPTRPPTAACNSTRGFLGNLTPRLKVY